MRFRIFAVLLVLVVALVFLSGCISEEPTFSSTRYDYRLFIKTDTRIENVDLLVPIPTRGNRPVIGHDPVSDAFYTDPDNLWKYPPYPSTLPEHYDFTLVPVEDQYYLRLTASYMDPAEQIGVDYYNRTSLGDDFRPEFIPQLIDTLHPLGNESLFSPKQNLMLTAGSPEIVETHGNNPGYRYSYTVPVYAQYENGSQVEIYSVISGINEWSEGFDQHWSNRYSDSYSLTITGSPGGWIPAEGVVTAGKGNYREWQLNASPTSGAGE